jgi:hypothetical protein
MKALLTASVIAVALTGTALANDSPKRVNSLTITSTNLAVQSNDPVRTFVDGAAPSATPKPVGCVPTAAQGGDNDWNQANGRTDCDR